MSVVVNRDNSWGRAAERFADGIRYRTRGRIQIKTYFNGELYAGRQTSEFVLLQEGVADFAIGSTRQLVAAGERAEPFHHALLVPELCRARRRAGR